MIDRCFHCKINADYRDQICYVPNVSCCFHLYLRPPTSDRIAGQTLKPGGNGASSSATISKQGGQCQIMYIKSFKIIKKENAIAYGIKPARYKMNFSLKSFFSMPVKKLISLYSMEKARLENISPRRL